MTKIILVTFHREGNSIHNYYHSLRCYCKIMRLYIYLEKNYKNVECTLQVIAVKPYYLSPGLRFTLMPIPLIY